jgi:hypothetical protein
MTTRVERKKKKLHVPFTAFIFEAKLFKDAVNKITKYGNRKVTYSSIDTSEFIYIKGSHTFSPTYHSIKQFPHATNNFFYLNKNSEIGKMANSYTDKLHSVASNAEY